jgi:uncharacterized membrane protein YphA (DoxX/SURF4 family)
MKGKALFGLQLVLAAVFLAAGGAKLAGVPMMVQTFDAVGAGQWFRYLTGALEVGGGLALLAPAFAGWSAGMLGCVMAGAILAHATRVPGSPVPAVVLLLLCGLVAYAKLAPKSSTLG